MDRAMKLRALRRDVRHIIEEAPKRSVNKGGKPNRLPRVQAAFRNRAAEGLAEYVAARIADPDGSEGFHSLAEQNCFDLTFEWLAIDGSKPYADLPEIIQVRHIARQRLRQHGVG